MLEENKGWGDAYAIYRLYRHDSDWAIWGSMAKLCFGHAVPPCLMLSATPCLGFEA